MQNSKETLNKERQKFEFHKTPVYTEETPINNLVDEIIRILTLNQIN